jgi:hypothetical protein
MGGALPGIRDLMGGSSLKCGIEIGLEDSFVP